MKIDITEVRDEDRGKKSEDLIGKRSSKYYLRTNIIAKTSEEIAPMVGFQLFSCNTTLFESGAGAIFDKRIKEWSVCSDR